MPFHAVYDLRQGIKTANTGQLHLCVIEWMKDWNYKSIILYFRAFTTASVPQFTCNLL